MKASLDVSPSNYEVLGKVFRALVHLGGEHISIGVALSENRKEIVLTCSQEVDWDRINATICMQDTALAETLTDTHAARAGIAFDQILRVRLTPPAPALAAAA